MYINIFINIKSLHQVDEKNSVDPDILISWFKKMYKLWSQSTYQVKYGTPYP